MRFLNPNVTNWLLAMPVAFLFWFLYVGVKRRFRQKAAITGHLKSLSRMSTTAGDVALLGAGVFAIAMLVVATARPQLLVEIQVPNYEKHDLILMLDRSASMLAQDIKPTRFVRAIEEIEAFLRKKPDTIDRVGLIGFSGSSLILSRLTADQTNLFFYLDWMKEDDRIYWGTDMGAALADAIALTEKDTQTNPKIYVLLSDGDDNGPNLVRSLALARQRKIRVHTIGVGGDFAVPMPVIENGRPAMLKDENGEVLMTRFSAATLTNVASLTGGRYYREQTGNELTNAMYDIVSAERKLTGWTAVVQYHDLYREALMLSALATAFLLIKL